MLRDQREPARLVWTGVDRLVWTGVDRCGRVSSGNRWRELAGSTVFQRLAVAGRDAGCGGGGMVVSRLQRLPGWLHLRPYHVRAVLPQAVHPTRVSSGCDSGGRV